MPPRPLQIGRLARAHIQEAKENYERYERQLQNPADISWALVSLFYSALHLVQAHAIAKCPTRLWPGPPEKHVDRTQYISDHLGDLDTVYRRLKDASEDVRYSRWKPTADEVKKYHDTEFAKISEHLHSIGVSWF